MTYNRVSPHKATLILSCLGQISLLGNIPHVPRLTTGRPAASPNPPFQKSEYPGVAYQLGTWFGRMGVTSNCFDPQARKPLGRWLVLKSPGANPRFKFPFDHMDAHSQQNRKIQYPGVVQLVARVVWEDGCGIQLL